jgi:CDP-glucose 4,6-dehydratase
MKDLSWFRGCFHNSGVALSTARAGNVIGGGDFSADRVIPDCVRAVLAGEEILP